VSEAHSQAGLGSEIAIFSELLSELFYFEKNHRLLGFRGY
jgi:hypothetical protein